MNTLPEHVSAYKKTKLFTSECCPAAFLKEHSTAEGVWGVLHITKGGLVFCDDETGEDTPLTEGEQTVIATAMRHHLKLEGYAEFFVEFYR